MENNNMRPTAEFTLAPPALLPGLCFDRTVTGEAVTDFSLPDYLPEIKRLLRVSPTVLPDTRYLGAGSAEFSGVIEYLITYAGGEGGLWSCRLRQDYTMSTPIDSDLLAHGLDPVADTEIDSTVSRVTGPRKINIRSRLRSRIRAWGEESVEPQIEGNPSPASLERLIKPCRAMHVLRAESDLIDLGDEISLPQQNGEVRIVRAAGSVHVSDAVAGDESVMCRGELIFELFTAVEREGMPGLPEKTVRKIAFSESIPMPGVQSGMAVRAFGRCAELSAELEEERILCDAAICLSLEAVGEDIVKLTADLYSTDGEIDDPIYREVEVCMLSRMCEESFTVNESLSAKEAGIDPSAQIVDIDGVPSLEEMEIVHGQCRLSGSCRFSMIYCLDGEYGVSEFSLPIRFVCECGEAIPTDREVNMTVVRANVRADGEGESRRIQIDAEFALAMRLFARKKRRILARACYRPLATVRESGCVICYPEPEDSLWTICRRYRVSRAEVEVSNHLRRDVECDLPASLEGVQYLLI